MRGFLIGFGVALWEAMMMELVPGRLLSRVVSLDYFGSYGLMPVGLALSRGICFAEPAELIGGGADLSALSSSWPAPPLAPCGGTSPSSRPARRVR